MVGFPYIDIIQNASAPVIVLFGLAHAAIGWVVYTIAKDLHTWMVEFFEEMEFRFRADKNARDVNKFVDEIRSSGRRKMIKFSSYVVKALVFFACWGIIHYIKHIYIINSPPL